MWSSRCAKCRADDRSVALMSIQSLTGSPIDAAVLQVEIATLACDGAK